MSWNIILLIFFPNHFNVILNSWAAQKPSCTLGSKFADPCSVASYLLYPPCWIVSSLGARAAPTDATASPGGGQQPGTLHGARRRRLGSPSVAFRADTCQEPPFPSIQSHGHTAIPQTRGQKTQRPGRALAHHCR